jgi:Protein of unknown function (DUF2844)
VNIKKKLFHDSYIILGDPINMARPCLFLVLVLLVGGPAARASLGDNETSLEKDRAALKASAVTSTPTGSYTVHELVTGARRVREYASPDGTIFAVTWSGVGHPDLSALLGSYFADFEATNRKLASGKHHAAGRVAHSTVTGEKVVVRRSGHMRSARGLAYVPSLVPQGVSPNDLQ